MQDLVYIGIDRAGLEEARRDVERHAAKVAAEVYAALDRRIDQEEQLGGPDWRGMELEMADAVRIAFTCDDMWPVR